MVQNWQPAYVPLDVAEDFPTFDLTVLTQKQLDVLVMRYRGGLSWRKIAAFEGVYHYAIQKRHNAALRKLCRQINTCELPKGVHLT